MRLWSGRRRQHPINRCVSKLSTSAPKHPFSSSYPSPNPKGSSDRSPHCRSCCYGDELSQFARKHKRTQQKRTHARLVHFLFTQYIFPTRNGAIARSLNLTVSGWCGKSSRRCDGANLSRLSGPTAVRNKYQKFYCSSPTTPDPGWEKGITKDGVRRIYVSTGRLPCLRSS